MRDCDANVDNYKEVEMETIGFISNVHFQIRVFRFYLEA